ncbi:hypothetical protein BJP41_05930 [Candidatus Williamhamiltonella defendens]|uniref:Uncharacterized protein n=2 Tax=Candidatus Williamhamiltonella defendens TaxID=138072 RepID=A0A2D3T2L8_9ENTR|nr:hypothetical protein HDEF_0758 [Candidatus Hamiltonella defensa 5AT (Acyrthosiphon pisum)]ATW22203.1 hypothetical protein BJP44_03480 [Candidatus Hamiltonella defensa]ATW29944.1 hypothetical protein BJP41_05930 [Candidatus Hamiltonella defensa]ATW31916.1 hypothetical protein BJP42_06025 [Candidatus Hamiltonella defensa]ATW34014.1 hypothetical protein BJP43_06805 [Candidatus Hamiltonella defensa]
MGIPVEAGHLVGKAAFIEINQRFSLLLIAAYFLLEQAPPLSLPWGEAEFFYRSDSIFSTLAKWF